MTAGRGSADQDAATRLQPPLVCCIRLFYSAERFPRPCRQPVQAGPDRTPDSRRGARLRDPEGCGTARLSEATKPARLRRPPATMTSYQMPLTLTRPPRAQALELSDARPRDQGGRTRLSAPQPALLRKPSRQPSASWGGAACESIPEPARRVHTRDGFPFVVHPRRSRTLALSCEAPKLAGLRQLQRLVRQRRRPDLDCPSPRFRSGPWTMLRAGGRRLNSRVRRADRTQP